MWELPYGHWSSLLLLGPVWTHGSFLFNSACNILQDSATFLQNNKRKTLKTLKFLNLCHFYCVGIYNELYEVYRTPHRLLLRSIVPASYLRRDPIRTSVFISDEDLAVWQCCCHSCTRNVVTGQQRKQVKNVDCGSGEWLVVFYALWKTHGFETLSLSMWNTVLLICGTAFLGCTGGWKSRVSFFTGAVALFLKNVPAAAIPAQKDKQTDNKWAPVHNFFRKSFLFRNHLFTGLSKMTCSVLNELDFPSVISWRR